MAVDSVAELVRRIIGFSLMEPSGGGQLASGGRT
jgi:hypothetical protein